MEDAKAKSSGVQVKSVKSIEDKYILELHYGGEMAKGYVFADHNTRESFINLFLITNKTNVTNSLGQRSKRVLAAGMQRVCGGYRCSSKRSIIVHF